MNEETKPLDQPSPMTAQPGKKLKDMSELERRQYNRERKAASRERARITKAQNIRAEEYKPPEVWTNALNEFVAATDRAIRAELGSISTQDEYIVAMLAECSMGLDKGYTMIVNEPYGVKAGRYFPEAAAAATVEYVYRYPALLESETFKTIYEQFLHAVTKWADKNPVLADEKCIADVKAALSGKYKLPAPQIPKAAPEPAPPEPPIPNEREIFEQGRVRLLERLYRQDPNIPSEARRYLDGI